MRFIFSSLFFVACILALPAQTLNEQLKPLLPTLDTGQSAKVLDYAHFLGAYYGRPLEATCKLLNTANQERVVQYIHFLKNTGAPEPTIVRFLRDTIPFAQIDEGTILLDSFQVVNTGKAPYFISGAKGGCDCTAVGLPKFPVMPGDTATIRVEFDSIKKAGHTTPGIILYDNSRPNRRNLLFMDGEIKPKGNVKVIVKDGLSEH